jgi:type IV pilus biogenesis protein CpaD/CtpE
MTRRIFFPQRRRSPAVRIAGAAGLALALVLLAACERPTPDPLLDPMNIGRAQNPANEFQVHQVQLSHQLRFAPGEVRLDAAERQRFGLFLMQSDLAPADAIYVAGGGQLGNARRQHIVDELAGLGLSTPVAVAEDVGADIVAVIVERSVFLPTSCLGMGIPGRPDELLMPAPRCATDLNLARMVVDQNDLLYGRAMGPADGASAALAIARYRSNNITPLAAEGTQ